MPKVLILIPDNPSPPRYGAHLRILQQISGISRAAEVSLIIPIQRDQKTRYNPEKLANELNVKSVYQLENSRWWYVYKFLRLIFFVPRRIASDILPNIFEQPSRNCCWKVMRYWIRDLIKKYKPDIFVVNYSQNSWTIHRDNNYDTKFVLELHDILTINQYLQDRCMEQVNTKDCTVSLKPDYVHLRYVTSIEQLPKSTRLQLNTELKDISKFDLVWSIGERETNLIASIYPEVKLKTIFPTLPYTRNACQRRKPNDNYAILPIGPNIFNTYSLLRFLKEVEPLIDYDKNCSIVITGSSWANKRFSLPEHISYLGFIDDYYKALTRARFVIAPTLVGTGQQVKIFEALFYGIPIICYRQAVPNNIDSFDNGVISAESPQEFAQSINMLWHDEVFYNQLRESAIRFSLSAQQANDDYILSLSDLLNNRMPQSPSHVCHSL